MRKITGIAVLLVFACALDCSAQSIADIARKERERQKSVQSKIVVTSTVTVTAKGDASPPSTSPLPPTKPIEPLDNRGRGEKYWRAAFQEARDDAKRAEDRTQLIDLKIKDLETRLLRQGDLYNRENRVGLEITAAQKEFADAVKEAAQAKQKISDLEDELRKAGGLPGWAR